MIEITRVKDRRRSTPPPSERQLAYREAAQRILRRAEQLTSVDGSDYRVRSIASLCGRKSAQVVEADMPGNPLVAAVVCEQGKRPKPTLFGSLTDGTPVQVSTAEVKSFGTVVVFRKGDVGNGDPWTILFDTKGSPYLQAVGIK